VNARGRILIVDDHVDLAENLAEILGLNGHQCQIVDSAERALAALHEGAFAGVITDLRLPGLSGLDLLDRLRDEGNSTPLILISAFASDAVVARAQAAGALGVLDKPVDLERLQRLVAQVSSSR